MNNIPKFLISSAKGLLALMLVTNLMACSEGEERKMPEEIAVEFVDAVYNSKDIDVIKGHATDKLADLVGHYRSVKMIQRHIMDLRLDSATIKVTDVGGDFFRKSKKDNKIELHIRGKFNGGHVADDRFLIMIWQDARWKVSKIKKS